MAGQVGQIAGEQDGLLGYLAQMRYVLRLTAYGLGPEQLRATPTAGTSACLTGENEARSCTQTQRMNVACRSGSASWRRRRCEGSGRPADPGWRPARRGWARS